MAEFRLRLAPPARRSSPQVARSFYWTSAPSTSTIVATSATPRKHFGPSLGLFGPVNDRNIDLVRVATAVFAADRSILRSGAGSNWNRRRIKLTVPVLDADVWKSHAGELKSVVDFLTGDDWTFRFVYESAPSENVAIPLATPKRVVLLSGGADSAAGALVSRSELSADESHLLVSHFSSTQLPPMQRDVATAAAGLVPGPSQDHLQFHCSRLSKRLDGRRYPSEQSARSRSLLFLALGLAVASVYTVPLWIPENGFASLNPPLGRNRLGSLSTRTTHPAFLEALQTLMTGVGGHANIVNPFQWATKGEMFSKVAGIVGQAEASSFLSSTLSCSHTDQRILRQDFGVGCGVCFGCVVRRASFAASGLRDHSRYVNADGDAAIESWLEGKSVEQAVERFARRGVSHRDVIALSLPASVEVQQALDLCQRGVAELGELLP